MQFKFYLINLIHVIHFIKNIQYQIFQFINKAKLDEFLVGGDKYSICILYTMKNSLIQVVKI